MEKKQGEITMLQQENQQWKTDIAFCRDELKVLNRYLQNMSEKNTSADMNAELADFQLKLSEKALFAHEIMHAVELHEEQLKSDSINREVLDDNHFRLRGKVKDFSKEYTALKSVFVRFLAKADILI